MKPILMVAAVCWVGVACSTVQADKDSTTNSDKGSSSGEDAISVENGEADPGQISLRTKICTQLFPIFLSLTMIVLAAACSTDDAKKGGAGETNSESDDSNGAGDDAEANNTKPAETPTADALAAAPVVVRNYNAIYNTYSALTGVDGANTNMAGGGTLREYFQTQLASGLPTTNEPATYRPASHVAVVKLAGEFCAAAYGNARRPDGENIFGVEFAAGPLLPLTDEGRHDLVTALMARFWGNDPEIVESDSDYSTMMNLQADITDVVTDMEGSTPEQFLEGVAVGSCSAALASVRTLFH